MAHPIYFIVFQLLLIVCYVMDMHPPVFTCCSYTHSKNTKLKLSSSLYYRAIALSSIFICKILDKTIMSLQSEYLITSELQFGFKEHFFYSNV